MAKLRKNAVVHSASGKFGEMIVFRQLRDGSTAIAHAPGKSTKEATLGQKVARKNFQRAVFYAQGVLADPEARKLYDEVAKKNPMVSAYNVAVADFSKAPSIDQVDLTKYTGKIGDTISIEAVDDFKVKEVHVTIYNSDGTIADQGMAEADPKIANIWLWVASNNATGDKIVVTASDIPGNIAKHEQGLA